MLKIMPGLADFSTTFVFCSLRCTMHVHHAWSFYVGNGNTHQCQHSCNLSIRRRIDHFNMLQFASHVVIFYLVKCKVPLTLNEAHLVRIFAYVLGQRADLEKDLRTTDENKLNQYIMQGQFDVPRISCSRLRDANPRMIAV